MQRVKLMLLPREPRVPQPAPNKLLRQLRLLLVRLNKRRLTLRPLPIALKQLLQRLKPVATIAAAVAIIRPRRQPVPTRWPVVV
jgi:hypothetical protein